MSVWSWGQAGSGQRWQATLPTRDSMVDEYTGRRDPVMGRRLLVATRQVTTASSLLSSSHCIPLTLLGTSAAVQQPRHRTQQSPQPHLRSAVDARR